VEVSRLVTSRFLKHGTGFLAAAGVDLPSGKNLVVLGARNEPPTIVHSRLHHPESVMNPGKSVTLTGMGGFPLKRVVRGFFLKRSGGRRGKAGRALRTRVAKGARGARGCKVTKRGFPCSYVAEKQETRGVARC